MTPTPELAGRVACPRCAEFGFSGAALGCTLCWRERVAGYICPELRSAYLLLKQPTSADALLLVEAWKKLS